VVVEGYLEKTTSDEESKKERGREWTRFDRKLGGIHLRLPAAHEKRTGKEGKPLL